MRKTIAIVSLIILAGLLYWYTGSKMEKPDPGPTEFDKVMDTNIDKDYPDNVEGVIAYNNKLVKYMFGSEENKPANFIEKQLPVLLDQQRKMYDKELLAVNSVESNLQRVTEEIKKNKEIGLIIIDSKVGTITELPFKDPQGRYMARATVIFYTNEDQNIYMEYGLREDGPRPKSGDTTIAKPNWKIAGFKQIDPFEITED